MRAVVCHGARDIRLEDINVAAPGPGEVRVKIAAGGICGSDLHYFQHGGFGAVRLKEPMILGHEVAGTIIAVGVDVTSVAIGDRVAVNPSKPCGHCRFCLSGLKQQCVDMRFNGSAMRFPHMQGIFRDELVVEAERAVPVGAETPFEEAAFAEPLAVALHAVAQAGSLVGKRVLVTGTGTIGCLVVLAAHHAGASEIVATDISDQALVAAMRVGTDRTVNVAADPEGLKPYAADKGYFDVAFECSGNGKALAGLADVVCPQGVVTLIGLGGDQLMPISTLVFKEIRLHGSFRFDREFHWAAELLANRKLDVRPLLTAVLPLDRAEEAFNLAADRDRSIKVQLSFA